MKPAYSQRLIGGCPTGATLLMGAPNWLATWSLVMPRCGVATSALLTAMPSAVGMRSAKAVGPTAARMAPTNNALTCILHLAVAGRSDRSAAALYPLVTPRNLTHLTL